MKRYKYHIILFVLILAIFMTLFECVRMLTKRSSETIDASTTTSSVTTDSTNNTNSNREQIGGLDLYPSGSSSMYLSEAESVLPKIIFETTAEENGLAGSIYLVKATILEDISYDEFVMATAKTGENKFVIADFVGFAANMGEIFLQSEPTANYTMPVSGDTVMMYITYAGYSEMLQLPFFYLGANEHCVNSLRTETPSTNPTEPHKTEPPKTEPPTTDSPGTEAPATESTVTKGMKNALSSAKSYLRFMSFSYNGLVDQLEYEGYSNDEAVYAADNCGANWNEQALKSAEDYLDFSAFSYSGLMEQLEYEQFTTSQAKYAADNCGADWYEQAAKSAEDYMDFMSYSRSELIAQLEYEGFTHDQAEYGADSVGLT